MNTDVKLKWIAALRSGEYKQGNGKLRTEDNKYCCLGVLSDLYNKETGKGQWLEDDGNAYSFKTNESVYSSSLCTLDVMKWAGIDSSACFVDGLDPKIYRARTLAYLNDNGTSFKEIAKIIEKHL